VPRRISILGSTGSIGRSALDVVRHYPGEFEVAVLAAHSNIEVLSRQVAEFGPRVVAVSDGLAAGEFARRHPGLCVLSGPGGLEEAAAEPVDTVLCGVVGAAGLRPLLAGIDAGNRIALANKESLVMAGKLVMERARQKQVPILPVDSEHNAIFQCLQGNNVRDVHCLHITASGGAFYGRPRESLENVTPQEALQHPTWDMGPKITIDSATLMNKGLEVIEAMWLFGLPLEKIRVLIHPQSVVHSLVEFTDGSILAQLGVTDMRFPILFALTWPERVQSPMARLDLAALRELTFAAPDFRQFPCLLLALEAAQRGGTAPAVLNAANEEAVSAFCLGRIKFLQIEQVVRGVLDSSSVEEVTSLEAVEKVDAATRRKAAAFMEGMI